MDFGTYSENEHIDKNRNITLVRGDTFTMSIVLFDANGNFYPDQGDRVVFGIQDQTSLMVLYRQVLTIDTDRARLTMDSNTTRALPVGTHFYDITIVQGGDANAITGTAVRRLMRGFFTVRDGTQGRV